MVAVPPLPLLEKVAKPGLYVKKLDISEINIVLTLHASLKAFVGLDRTPLKFSPVTLRSVLASPERLGRELSANYIADAIFRLPALIGSLEILGNPTGFFRAVGSGLHDLFALPIRSLSREGGVDGAPGGGGDWVVSALLRGIAQGWVSFLSHVSGGALSSLSGFASSVARNLDRLSLDTNHIQKHESARRQPAPGTVTGGLSSGPSACTAQPAPLASWPSSFPMKQPAQWRTGASYPSAGFW